MRQLKGVIVSPAIYERRGLKRDEALFARLCEKYNFVSVYSDSPDLEGYDVAMIKATPYHNRPNIPSGLLETKCKLIGYFVDLQCWNNAKCERNRELLFDKYDILIGTYYEKFQEWYPQYWEKYIHFPDFFAPYERFSELSINSNPIMKCLMSGARNTRAYPFRAYVAQKCKRAACGHLIQMSRGVPFTKYPSYLNRYFCALALAGVHDVPVSKYFEIPAANVLMLARRTKELDLCGFEPDVHYVPVTKKNVFGQIKKVLSSPDDYLAIRQSGTDFVLKNHSEINRAKIFKDVFNRLFIKGHERLSR